MLYALLYYLILLVLAYSVGIYLYFPIKSSNSNERKDELKNLNLPEKVAERRRLMSQDDNDETFERIKEAVRLKVARPKRSFMEQLYCRAGFYFYEDRRDTQWLAIISSLVCAMILGAYGYLISTTSIFYLAGLGHVVGLVIPFIFLSIKARRREETISIAISEILRPLKLTLNRGLEFNNKLEGINTLSWPRAEDHIVLKLFKEVLDRSAAGKGISEALLEVAEETEVSHYTHLSQVLALSHNKGTGWAEAFRFLSERIEEDLKVARIRNKKIVRSKFEEDWFTRY